MDDIVDTQREAIDNTDVGDADYERFLLEEGLDLVNAFRVIADARVRREIVQFVKKIAAAYGP